MIQCRLLLPNEVQPKFEDTDYVQKLIFDYEKIQDDVIDEFIVGKQMISDNMANLRIPFKYRKPKTVAVGVGVSEADVDALSNYLEDEFKVYRCNQFSND